MVFRYTRARHLALLGLFASGWGAIFVVVHYGFDGVSASIGLLAGWAMGLAIGLNARIYADARARTQFGEVTKAEKPSAGKGLCDDQ